MHETWETETQSSGGNGGGHSPGSSEKGRQHPSAPVTPPPQKSGTSTPHAQGHGQLPTSSLYQQYQYQQASVNGVHTTKASPIASVRFPDPFDSPYFAARLGRQNNEINDDEETAPSVDSQSLHSFRSDSRSDRDRDREHLHDQERDIRPYIDDEDPTASEFTNLDIPYDFDRSITTLDPSALADALASQQVDPAALAALIRASVKAQHPETLHPSAHFAHDRSVDLEKRAREIQERIEGSRLPQK